MFTKRIPAYYAIIGMVAIGLLSYFISRSNPVSPCPPVSETNTANTAKSCNYSLPRLGGYNYIRPLLFAEQGCESEKYLPLKQSISQILNRYKADGTITSASVYIKDLDEDGWIGVNDQERFDPGSLMKVPVMITFLKMSEDNPSILDKQVLFEGADKNLPSVTFKSKTIQAGLSYTIRELIRYMIVYSDNDAARLLLKQMDEKAFVKTFTDLGLSPPKKGTTYPFSAREYSVFMKVLYDGSYITIRNSEYANSLLVEAEFNKGIIHGIPSSVKAAHKFGEWGIGNVNQLHESGVVFYNKSPYLITVMTKGPEMNKLTDVLSSISRLTYESIASHNQ